MRITALILLSLVVALPYSLAFGVVNDYLKDRTLPLIPGQSHLLGVRILNSDENEMRVQVTYDESVIEIIDFQDTYVIPPKGKISLTFNVTAPEKAKPGDILNVGYTVHQTGGSGKGIPLLLKIAKSFNIEIIRDPNKFYFSDLYKDLDSYKHLPKIIILLVVIYFLFRPKKGKTKIISVKKRKIIKRKKLR